MRDLYELAKGSRRRSSATVASSIKMMEDEIASLDRLAVDSDEEKIVKFETIDRLRSLAAALRWVLGDEYRQPFASDCFGEDSAGV